MSDDAFAPDALRSLFDDNAATYDRVNTIVSLGLDARWREWAASRAAEHRGARVLDAFAGTGQTGIRAAQHGAEVTLADLSSGMLALARKRALKRGVLVRPVVADLTERALIPGAPFDAITAVFGVRYLADPSATLRLLGELLGQDGRLVVVEFVDPADGGVSRLARFYFMRILPVIASVLAGRSELYERLVSSTRSLHGAEQLERIVREAGLRIEEVRSMGFGLVIGIVATPARP